MKTYYIYNQNTDEFIGKLNADSILNAELKAFGVFGIGGEDVYALTTEPNETFA